MLQEFSKDAILVIAIPRGQVFYAQRFGELEIREVYDAETDLERFDDTFTEVEAVDLEAYREKAIRAMEK